MPTYDGTDDLSQLDVAVPNPLLEPISNDMLALKELKRVTVAVIEKAHNSDGTIKDNIIVDANFASKTITAASIADGTITSAQLAGGVGTPGALSVGTAALQDSSVTSAKILNGTIVGGDLAAKTVAVGNLDGGSTAGQIPITQGSNAILMKTISGDGTIDLDGVLAITKATTIPVVTAVNTAQITLTAADWTTRNFSEVVDSQNVAVFSGSFTLATGSYIIFCSCQTFNTGLHQIRLATGTGPYTAVLYGLSDFAGLDTNNTCTLFGAFDVVSSSTQYQIQHYIQYSHGVTDSGMSVGIADKYGELILVKYA